MDSHSVREHIVYRCCIGKNWEGESFYTIILYCNYGAIWHDNDIVMVIVVRYFSILLDFAQSKFAQPSSPNPSSPNPNVVVRPINPINGSPNTKKNIANLT